MAETIDTSPKTPQRTLLDIWQAHTMAEFMAKDTEEALSTMTEDAYVLCMPVLTGGIGKNEVRDFYSNYFIPQVPEDYQVTTISRAIGDDQLVEEAAITFTHTVRMDWMLPGIPATGKRVEHILVANIGFRDGKIAYERLYWDQASVLAQLGIIGADTPCITGAESARKLLEVAPPSPNGASG